MIYLLVIITIFFIVFSIYKEKNIYNPATIFFGIWFLVVFFAALKLYGMIDYSNKVVFIVFCGLLSFFLGYLLYLKFEKANATKYEIKYKHLYINLLLGFGVLISLILSIKVFGVLLSGEKYSSIRDMYYSFSTAMPLVSNRKLFALYELFSNGILFACFPVVLVSIFEKKYNKVSIILLIIFVLLHTFSSAARSDILKAVLEIFIVFMAMYKNLSKKTKKVVIYTLSACVLALLFITFLRINHNVKNVPTIYAYFGIPMPMLSYFVDYVNNNNIYLYGYSTFYGLYLLLQKFIVVIFGYKLPNADFLSNIIGLPGSTWIRVFQETHTNYNAYATMFYNFYLDFKLFGVILFSFLYGWICSFVYRKSLNSKYYLVYYLVLSTGLLFSFVKFQFSNYYVYLSLLLIYLIIKKEKPRPSIAYDSIKMPKELVSVIITTHNRLQYLIKAITSVEKQTYKNIEIIVVDDGSNDGTKKYVKSKKNIKYIFIPKKDHINGNYARNIGLKNASGDYVAFLDDDDEWLETKIEKQMKRIQMDSKIGVVYCGMTVEVNDGLFAIDVPVDIDICGDCSEKSLYNIISSTSALLFRKSALEDINYFDEKVNFWQDNEILISISQKYKIEYVDEELLIYRELINDKKKISNNINGFLDSVNYINSKYSKKINNLSSKEQKNRQVMIYNDVASRYVKNNDYKNCRKYLFEAFLIKPSLKSFIKVVLNYNNTRKIRLKVKILKKLGK